MSLLSHFARGGYQVFNVRAARLVLRDAESKRRICSEFFRYVLRKRDITVVCIELKFKIVAYFLFGNFCDDRLIRHGLQHI